MTPGELARAGGVFEDDRLIAKANRAQRDMWDRLEALPRTDGFWAGTNMRTTWFKVNEYATARLRDDPRDATARWALIAWGMDACVYSVLALIPPDEGDEVVLDLIGVAEWIWLEIGVEPVHELDDALHAIGRPALHRLATVDDTTTRQPTGDDAATRQPTGDHNAEPQPTGDDSAGRQATGDDTAARHITGDDGAVRRAAVAALAYLDRQSFDRALGRREWHVFQMALCGEPGDYWDVLAREQLRPARSRSRC